MNPIKTLAPCTRLPSKLPKSFWPRNSPCCTSRFANVCAQGSGLWPSLDWVCLVWLRPCVKLEIPIGVCAGCTGKPHKLANMCATDTRSGDDDDDGEDDEDDDDVGVTLSERRLKTSAEGIPPGNALCAGPERVGISHRHLGKFSMEKPEARSLFTCANMWSNSPQLT